MNIYFIADGFRGRITLLEWDKFVALVKRNGAVIGYPTFAGIHPDGAICLWPKAAPGIRVGWQRNRS